MPVGRNHPVEQVFEGDLHGLRFQRVVVCLVVRPVPLVLDGHFVPVVLNCWCVLAAHRHFPMDFDGRALEANDLNHFLGNRFDPRSPNPTSGSLRSRQVPLRIPRMGRLLEHRLGDLGEVADDGNDDQGRLLLALGLSE